MLRDSDSHQLGLWMTQGADTPVAAQWLGAGLAILLILANGSRTTAGLFTFVILLSTASILVLYLAGSLAAWRSSRRFERAVVIVAVGFSVVALRGTGAGAIGWGLVLLAIGCVLRLAMHRMAFARPSIPIAPDV